MGQKHMENNNIEKKLLPVIKVTDCLTYIPADYIVENLIETKTITLVSGREKIGKTFVLMNLGLSMAAELSWLGKATMQDDKGKVIWVNLDMPRNVTMRRVNMITHGLMESWDARKPDLFDNFILIDRETFREYGCTDNFQFFESSDAVEALQEYIISENVKVCFIDNLVQMEGNAQENDANNIQRVFQNLKALRDMPGSECAFIVIHHTGKIGERGRGSSAIFGETDLNLQLEPVMIDKRLPSKECLVLKTDGARNTAEDTIYMKKEFVPRISEDGMTPMTDENGHTIFNFKLHPVDGTLLQNVPESVKANNTLNSNINTIMNYFRLNGNEPACKTKLTKHLRGTQEKREEAVKAAVDRGIVVSNGKYYRLNPESSFENEGGDLNE